MERTRKPVPSRQGTGEQSPSTPKSQLAMRPTRSHSNDYLDTEHTDLPPTYSSYTPPVVLSPSSSNTQHQQAQQQHPISQPQSRITIPGLPSVDFWQYHVPDAKLSKDSTTLITTNTQFNWSAPHLLHLIKRHARLPPHPQISIIGKSRNGDGIDFDIKISMLRYIVRDDKEPGASAWNYVRTVGDNELAFRGGKAENTVPLATGLEEWVNRFVAEDNKEKSFTLRKIVPNWDTDYLRGQIHGLVASTGYRGNLTISFPITHSALTVQPANTSAWYQKLGQLFQPAQPRRYEVVTAVWPYAALAPGLNDGQGNTWAVRSEARFWDEWKDVLQWAILEQRKGWLTLEDTMEWAMGGGWAGKKQTKNWDSVSLQAEASKPGGSSR